MLRSLLSGLVSAASDNDPTTVGTVVVAGALTMYGLEWVLVLIVPMLAIVQILSTRLAGITRKGLQAAIRDRYGKIVGIVSMAAIVAVNLVTIGADLQAGAASLELMTHLSAQIWALPIALLLGVLLSVGSFNRVRYVFAILPLAFLAYAGAAFLAHPDWSEVRRGLVPHFTPTHQNVQTVLALLGTLLTAYAYLWQSVEVAKDRPSRRRLFGAELATLPGIVYTFVILWFILIASGATLGVHHRNVQTAQEAATSLAPLAGRWAPILFAIGLLGSALLAVPVIAAATANAICTTFRWRGSLDDPPRKARRHYAVIYVSLAVGAAMCFLRVPAISLLFIASIAGGLATPLTLVLLMLLVYDRRAMRAQRAPLWLATGGWAVTIVVTVAAIGYFFT
jgi:Mn2+/Fe2+ NRAMP family transporter